MSNQNSKCGCAYESKGPCGTLLRVFLVITMLGEGAMLLAFSG